MDPGDTKSTRVGAEPPKKGLRTALFVGIITIVVGGLYYLSSLDHPPNLPANAVHQFRFDTQNRLVGLAIEAPGEPLIVEHVEMVLDKKAVEARMNIKCAECHGAPGQDLRVHGCAAAGICVPAQHPPKATCIACHRHGKK